MIRVTLFRSGAAATPGFAREWEPERAREVFEVWKERGLLDYAGTPMPTEVIARSIVHAVTRPAGASVDFLELRSS